MTRPCDEHEFLNSVREHTLEILRDDHVYRHLRLRKPGTSVMGFDIVTYPGYLCYSGDMGCFVFSRIHDMFAFFRGKTEGALEINPSYWSEKLDAVEKSVGDFQEYDAQTFRARIAEELKLFREHIERDTDIVYDEEDNEDHAATQRKVDETFDALKNAIESEVLSKADDGEYAVYNAMSEFEHDDRHWFQDIGDMRLREYTYRFLWCCFALVWGIRQYDLQKSKIRTDATQATG